MAFSPCPRCQNKGQFDKMSLSEAAFVVEESKGNAVEFYSNSYVCTRNQQHAWDNFGAIWSELKRAGYLQVTPERTAL